MAPIDTWSCQKARERILLVYDADHGQAVMRKLKEKVQQHLPNKFSFVNINKLLIPGTDLITEVAQLVKNSYRTIVHCWKATSSAIISENVNHSSTASSLVIDAAIMSGLAQVIRTGNRTVIVMSTDNDRKTLPEDLKICAQLNVHGDWTELFFYLCTEKYALRGTLELYNVGYCMAVGFVYSYVNGYFDELREMMRGTKYYKRGLLSRKMYVLLPKSYRMPDAGGFIDGRRIKLVKTHRVMDSVVENVAGITKRIYRNNICRILDESRKKKYYAHVEYGMPLSSLKAVYDENLVSIPPDDWAWLRKEMENYGQLLMRLDRGLDRIRVIFYDDEVADWNDDRLPDMLFEAIIKDVEKPEPEIPSKSDTKGESQTLDNELATTHQAQTVMILPVRSSAEEDFPEVFTALRRLRDNGREVVWHSGNPADSSAALGETILDSINGGIEYCRYFVLVASRRDFPGPGGGGPQEADDEIQFNLAQLALNELLIRLIPRREMSLVLLTDCADASDISPYLSPFFLKLIRLRKDYWSDEIYDQLQNALDPNPVHGIKYLNIGHCLAVQYAYSYLRYKLPRLDECYAGRGWTYRGVTIPRKLFVILQRSAKITLAADSGMVEEEAYAPSTIEVMRACVRREYPSTLYRISHANKVCYALVELAACVRTVGKVADEYKLGDKWKDEEALLFKQMLSKILFHERSIEAGYTKLIKFIYYDDITADKPLSEVLVEAIFEELQVSDVVAMAERADTSHEGSSPHRSSSPYSSVTSVGGGGDSCDASTESRTVSDLQSAHFGSGDDNDQSVIEEHGPVEVVDGSRGDANEMRNERPAGAECENASQTLDSNIETILDDYSSTYISGTAGEYSDVSTLSRGMSDSSMLSDDCTSDAFAINDSADLQQRIASDVTHLIESRLPTPMSPPSVHEEIVSDGFSELAFVPVRPEPSMSDESNELPSVLVKAAFMLLRRLTQIAAQEIVNILCR